MVLACTNGSTAEYFSSYQKYEGDWINNQMHRRGKYEWKDGRKYDGEYHYDKKQGFGIYIWTDGRRYEG